MSRMHCYFCVSLGVALFGQCNAAQSEAISQEPLGRWELSLTKANYNLEEDGSYDRSVFLTGGGRYKSAEADSFGIDVAYVHQKEYLVRFGLANISYIDNSEFFGEVGYRFYLTPSAPLSISTHLGYSTISDSGINILSTQSEGNGTQGVDGGLYVSGGLDYFITDRWKVGITYRRYLDADVESTTGMHISLTF